MEGPSSLFPSLHSAGWLDGRPPLVRLCFFHRCSPPIIVPETLCQGRKRIKLKNQVLQSADHSKLEYQAAVTPITQIRRIQVSSQAKGILLAASDEHHGAAADFTTSGDQQPAIPRSEPKSSSGAAEDWSCGSI
nr:uncharacterized protein LOC109737801 isoform X2 [Aegilops tauschii subsp. strangulata]